MNKPLTYDQACQLQQAFLWLKGQPFESDKKTPAVVKEVAIIPWDDLNKQIFLEYYKSRKNIEHAIVFYQKKRFNVGVIAWDLAGTDCFLKDLRQYCSEFKVPFDRKKYIKSTTYAKLFYGF
jgi:hypothetical protein